MSKPTASEISKQGHHFHDLVPEVSLRIPNVAVVLILTNGCIGIIEKALSVGRHWLRLWLRLCLRRDLLLVFKTNLSCSTNLRRLTVHRSLPLETASVGVA